MSLFEILQLSNLPRSFAPYFISPVPDIIACLAAFCLLVLTRYVFYPSERRRESGPMLRVLYVGSAVAFLGLMIPVAFKHRPEILVNSISIQAASIYDLTPMGVQIIVDLLFWSVLLSSLSYIFIALLTFVYIAEIRIPTGGIFDRIFEGFVYIRLKDLWVLIVPIIAFSGIAVILIFHMTNAIRDERIHRDICIVKAEKHPLEVVGEYWKKPEDCSVSSKLRDSSECSPYIIDVRVKDQFIDQSVGQFSKLQVKSQFGQIVPTSIVPNQDLSPIDIVVIPYLSDRPIKRWEEYYSVIAKTLLEPGNGFAITGYPQGDRIYLGLKENDGTLLNLAYFLDEVAFANALNEFARSKKGEGILHDGYKTGIKDLLVSRNVEQHQSSVITVVVVLRLSDFEIRRYDKQYYSQLQKEINSDFDSSISLLFVDLLESPDFDSTESFAEELGDRIKYLQIQFDDSLVLKGKDWNVEHIMASIKAQNISSWISGQRKGLRIALDTKKVWAYRDSPSLFLQIDQECALPFPPGSTILSKFGNEAGSEHEQPKVSSYALAFLTIGLQSVFLYISFGVFMLWIVIQVFERFRRN